MTLIERAEAINAELNRRAGRREALQAELSSVEEQQAEHISMQSVLADALALVNNVSITLQDSICSKLTAVVQTAIDAVFPGNRFVMEFVTRRNQSEVDMFLTDEKGAKQSILDGSGGGLKDIVSYALRIAIWSLDKTASPVILLDEPFKFLSAAHREQGAHMLKALADDLGLQFIVVSHVPEIIEVSDSVFKIVKGQDGVSRLKSS